MSVEKEFAVLYTHQKQKKAKTWQDGVLCIPASGNRAILYDDKKTKLDALYVKADEVTSGEQLESDRYLISVEQEIKTASSGNLDGKLKSKPTLSASHGSDQYFSDCSKTAVNQDSVCPSAPSLPISGVRTGPKRKNTGFVPPRMVKQPKQDEEDTASPLQLPPNSEREQGFTLAQPLISGRVDILNMYSSRRWDSTYYSSVSQDSKRNVQDNSLKNTLAQDFQQENLLVAKSISESCKASQTRASSNHPPKQSSPWTSYGSGLSSVKFNSPMRQTCLMDKPAISLPQSSNLISLPESPHTFDQIQSECDSGIVNSYHRVSDISIPKESINDSTYSHEVTIQQKRTASQIMALLGGPKTFQKVNPTSVSQSRYLHRGHNSDDNMPKDESRNAHINIYGQNRDSDKLDMKTLDMVAMDRERILSNHVPNKVSIDVLPKLDNGSVYDISNSCHHTLNPKLRDNSSYSKNSKQLSESDKHMQNQRDSVKFQSGNTDCSMSVNGTLYKEPLKNREVDLLGIETGNKYLKPDSSPEITSQTDIEDVKDIIKNNVDNSVKSIKLNNSSSVYQNIEEDLSDEIKLDISEPAGRIESSTVISSQSDNCGKYKASYIDLLHTDHCKKKESDENNEIDAEINSDGTCPNDTDLFTANFSISFSPLSQVVDSESETESLQKCGIQINETGFKIKAAQLDEGLKIGPDLEDENMLIHDALQVEHEFEAGNIFASNSLKSEKEFKTINAQMSETSKIEKEFAEENSSIFDNITLIKDSKEENIKASDRLKNYSDLKAESIHICFPIKNEKETDTENSQVVEILRDEIKSETQNMEVDNTELFDILRKGKALEIQNIQIQSVSNNGSQNDIEPKFNILGIDIESECSAESDSVNWKDNKLLKKDLETDQSKNKLEENFEWQNVLKDNIQPNYLEVYSRSQIILEKDIHLEISVEGNNQPQNTSKASLDQLGGSVTTPESRNSQFESGLENDSQSNHNLEGNCHSDNNSEGNSQPKNNWKEPNKSCEDYISGFTSSVSYSDNDFAGNVGISASITNVCTKNDLTGLNQRPIVLEGLEFSQDSLKLFSTQSSVTGDILGKEFPKTKQFDDDTLMSNFTKECSQGIENDHSQIKEIAIKNEAEAISNGNDKFIPDNESGLVVQGFAYDSEKQHAIETQSSVYTDDSLCSTKEVNISLIDERVYMKSSLCLWNEDVSNKKPCTFDDKSQSSSVSQNSWLAIGSQSSVQSVGMIPELFATNFPSMTSGSEMRVKPMDPLFSDKFSQEPTVQSKEISFSDCISLKEMSIKNVSQDFSNDSCRDMEVRRPEHCGEELNFFVHDTEDSKLSYQKSSATNGSDFLYYQRAQKCDKAKELGLILSDDRISSASFIVKHPDLPEDPIGDQTDAVAESPDDRDSRTGFTLWKGKGVPGPNAAFAPKQWHQQNVRLPNLVHKIEQIPPVKISATTTSAAASTRESCADEKEEIQDGDNVYQLVTSLPHPSELLGSESIAGGQRKITIKDHNITEKILTRLEGYKIRGSISGGTAMRDTSSVSRNFPAFGSHQGFQIEYSPLTQRLDGYSTNVQSASRSPSLFVDWNEGKPKFMEKRDISKLQTEESYSPFQHVPEQCFPSPRVSGDDDNDDQLYQRIFQPRHVLSRDEADGIENSNTRSSHQQISEQMCRTLRNMAALGCHDMNKESPDLGLKNQQEHYSIDTNIFSHCSKSVDSRLFSPNLEGEESQRLSFRHTKSHLPRRDAPFGHIESNFPDSEESFQHFKGNSSDEDACFRFRKPREHHLERKPIVTTPCEVGAAIIVGRNDRISVEQPDYRVPRNSLNQEMTFKVEINGLDEEGELQSNTVCERDKHSNEACVDDIVLNMNAADEIQFVSALPEKGRLRMQMCQGEILPGLQGDASIRNNKKCEDFEFLSSSKEDNLQGISFEQKSFFGKPITFHDSQLHSLEQNSYLRKFALLSGAISTDFDGCPQPSEKDAVPGSRWGKYIPEETDDEVEFESLIKEDRKASAVVPLNHRSASARISSPRPEYFSGQDQRRFNKEDFREKSDIDSNLKRQILDTSTDSVDAELDSFNEDFLNSYPSDAQREESHFKDNLTHCTLNQTQLSKQTTWFINDFQTRTCEHLDSSRNLDVSNGKGHNLLTLGGSKRTFLQGALNRTLPQGGSDNALLQRLSKNALPQELSHNTLPLGGSDSTLPQGSSRNTLPKRGSNNIFKQTEGRSQVMSRHSARNSQFRSPMLRHSPSDEQKRDNGFPVKNSTMRTSSAESFRIPSVSNLSSKNTIAGTERSLTAELIFPSKSEVEHNSSLLREMRIPVSFPSVAVYKQVLTAAIKEHLNLQLFEVSKKYHHSLAKVDTSGYQLPDPVSVEARQQGGKALRQNPPCQCGASSKMVQVKKEGPNKGKYFYACSAARSQQCKFFQWANQITGGKSKGLGSQVNNKLQLSDAESLMTYLRDHKVIFFCECIFLKRVRESTKHYLKGVPSWVRKRTEDNSVQKPHMLIKLPKKDPSSFYAREKAADALIGEPVTYLIYSVVSWKIPFLGKVCDSLDYTYIEDDLWIVSQHLEFDPNCTFLARSSYFGPNSNNEVEIEPLAGFLPSNWPKDVMCYAILAGNASTELGCLHNIQDHIQTNCPPVLPYLLSRDQAESRGTASTGFQVPRMVNSTLNRNAHAPEEYVSSLAMEYIVKYKLNPDQAEAIRRMAAVFTGTDSSSRLTEPVLLIHGVFGAGKSFLLSIAILFLVRLFEVSDSYTPGVPYPWKILISSTTNVAVDRILLGLLELGFEDFIRVGSIKKIAKPVLPYSVHATGTDSQELQELQNMLRSGDLTPAEKHHVRQSIDKHRLGENKKKLVGVRVVGVTCASCAFSCLDKMKFPFVLLDECSQMTEPASLLPIARFECEKLILVGDPKQLDPTVQGSEAAHQEGLEQTLFDRCMKMGYVPTMLRMQYRCHPQISAVSNHLFYSGQLKDGVTEEDREPVITEFPALCFIDVSNGQEVSAGVASFYNEAEAEMVVFLIEVLVNCRVDPASIGVITLYKSQMSRVLLLLHNSKHAVHKELRSILVSTVDAFQGGERDVIILSCVRTDFVGFIDNDKRTNVALTRAKKHLLIVGNYRILSHNKLWGQILQHCQALPRGIQKSTEVRSYLYYLHTLEEPTGSCLDSEKSPQQSMSQKSNIDITPKKKRKRSKKAVQAQSSSGSELSISEIKDLTPSGNHELSFRKRRKVENKTATANQCNILNSPPMSLSDEEDLINPLSGMSPVFSQEGESLLSIIGDTQETRHPSTRKPAKRMWKSDQLDPTGFCLETSDKENTDDELPSFNM